MMRTLQPLDGNRVMAVRRAMGLGVDELASVLGTHRTTLYRWEADGFFRHHVTAASRVMQWLTELDEPTLTSVGDKVRAYVKTKSYLACQLELFTLMIRAQAPAVRQRMLAHPQAATGRKSST